MKRETYTDKLGGYVRVTETSHKPFTCPVCGGRGHVHAGFYSLPNLTAASTSGGLTTCRACIGRGIVWEAKP